MTDKELVERLNAYSAQYQNHGGITAEAADRIEQLRAELTNEKIDNTNLIGELATVAAERDRYKAERDAAARNLCQLCKKEAARIGCETLCNRCAWRGLEGNA
ncbi:hypothetical protein [Ruthenibacterium lactatiformans]|uniref:hypothetical protein n=1 Tax=Ruthenibacterium lactatiformans TaxID=1550024 RepID=UPI00196733B0|nr:hypothetical protein [Ruthenibacterium lactatiformans]MBN2995836.1 hypothetical protein [Ruthenibacterium lactatiformans]